MFDLVIYLYRRSLLQYYGCSFKSIIFHLALNSSVRLFNYDNLRCALAPSCKVSARPDNYRSVGLRDQHPKICTFYNINHDEHVYFGQSSKNKRDITLDEYSAALKPVRDDELYPTIPTDVSLTIAPADLDDHTAFVKRPGFVCYEEMKGTSYIPSVLLNETIIMETISELPHPNIV